MALPEPETDPTKSPMIGSDCTCCDYCVYCDGMDQQGEIGAVLHDRKCPWMAKRFASGLPMNEECYQHRFDDEPEILSLLDRLEARGVK